MKKLIKSFANLKLAIVLLLLIAFFSALGSIIDQDKSIEFYQKNYSSLIFNIPVWVYLKFFLLNQIYSAWWFFILLIIFGVCLLSCTFLQQFPALKFARRYYFYSYQSQFNKLKFKFTATKTIKSQACFRLIENNYSIFQNNKGFYSYKGLVGRIGPVIVHLSIICILVGSIFGALKGFTAQEFVPKSEIFHIQNIVKSGQFSKISQQAIRINDFWIDYNKLGLIKQFQSDISILSGKGNEVVRKTISVNNPLSFKGLTFYQTDWGVSGLRLKITNKNLNIQLPVSKTLQSSQKLWVSWLPLNLPDKTGLIILLNTARGKIELYNENAQFLQNITIGQSIDISNALSINILEFIFSTGIQIKADPGIAMIYTGFGFLILSSFVSYVSFSEIWLLETANDVLVGGQTNRAKVKFKIEIARLKKSFSEKIKVG
jgi:cytochrome c biogenesis protein